MRAGKLDRTITLQRSTQTVTAAGTPAVTWSDFANVRAELMAGSVAETGQPFGEADNVTQTFLIRYRADLSTKDRVLYAGRAFDLVGIREIGRRRALELQCEAVE